MQLPTDAAESFEPTSVLTRLLWQWLVVGALLAVILPGHASLWLGPPWLLGVAAPAATLLTLNRHVVALAWLQAWGRRDLPTASPTAAVDACRRSSWRISQARRTRNVSQRQPAPLRAA